MAVQAEPAGIAGDMMGDEDPVADFVTVHSLSGFDDFSPDLMP
jgi:hypothetical protein